MRRRWQTDGREENRLCLTSIVLLTLHSLMMGYILVTKALKPSEKYESEKELWIAMPKTHFDEVFTLLLINSCNYNRLALAQCLVKIPPHQQINIEIFNWRRTKAIQIQKYIPLKNVVTAPSYHKWLSL